LTAEKNPETAVADSVPVGPAAEVKAAVEVRVVDESQDAAQFEVAAET
jgi:hypothetical protein